MFRPFRLTSPDPPQCEAAVLRSVKDLLESRGIRCLRLHCGGFWKKNNWIQLQPEGTPDLLVLLNFPPWHLWIETKRTKGGQLSASQEGFRHLAEAQGDGWIMPGSAQEVGTWLNLHHPQ